MCINENDINNKALGITEVQRISLKVLIEIDSICREKGLDYTLAYGTLIGAIRHKGFIPWDDDVDIIMPRTDYEKLRSFFIEKYSGNLKWCDRTTVKNYPYCISRVSDMKYRYKTSVKNQKDFDIGAFIDIYPLDNYCDTEKQAFKLGRKVWLKNRLFDLNINPDNTKGNTKKIIRNMISRILRIKYGKDWNLSIDRKIYDMISKKTNSNNEIVGVISQYEWKELMRKEWFSSYTEIEFENHNFLICQGWQELLTSIYGDYMKLPEESKRIPTHDYKIEIRTD